MIYSHCLEVLFYNQLARRHGGEVDRITGQTAPVRQQVAKQAKEGPYQGLLAPCVLWRRNREAALTAILLVSLSLASQHESIPVQHNLDQATNEKDTSNYYMGLWGEKKTHAIKVTKMGTKKGSQSQGLQYPETTEALGQFFPRCSGRRNHFIFPLSWIRKSYSVSCLHKLSYCSSAVFMHQFLKN